MKRFKSSYGGIETIVGTFHRDMVEVTYGITLPHHKEEGKVIDVMQERREVIGYMVDDDHFELRCINR